jgi:hypothetical protein
MLRLVRSIAFNAVLSCNESSFHVRRPLFLRHPFDKQTKAKRLTSPLAHALLPFSLKREMSRKTCQFGSLLPPKISKRTGWGRGMRHRATRELFDYWNELRGSRAAPERAEIDLAAIRGLLADMFMLEVDAAHRFPFVMSGTRINAFSCSEQNGRPFLDLWAAQKARNVAAMLLTVVDAACPTIATAMASPIGWQDHEIEILLLPLGCHLHDRARILGLIAPTTPPSWLGLLPAKDWSLRSWRMINDATDPARFPFDPPFTPTQAPAQPQDKSGRAVRHFRVFQGGRKIS